MRAGGLGDHDPVIVIEHQEDAPAGLLGEWLGERQIRWENVRATIDPLPDPAAAAAIVTLGSEHSAYSPLPEWIGEELSFLRAALARGTPVLGICFGAQALALAGQGRVGRAARPEVGWVNPRSDVEQLRGPWLSWHYDAIDLPPGAVELARSDGALQAFTLGPHLGLQFHPEVTPAIWQGWAQGQPAVVARHAGDARALALQVSACVNELRARVFALLDWWYARLLA